jgi:hypothetical protein
VRRCGPLSRRLSYPGTKTDESSPGCRLAGSGAE